MDSWEEARRYSALDERDVRIKELEQEVAELRKELEKERHYTQDELSRRKGLGREVERLRERVGELEGVLKFTDDWFKGTRGDSGFNPMPPGAYQVHEIVHTALSQANAQAKLETRSGEEG